MHPKWPQVCVCGGGGIANNISKYCIFPSCNINYVTIKAWNNDTFYLIWSNTICDLCEIQVAKITYFGAFFYVIIFLKYTKLLFCGDKITRRSENNKHLRPPLVFNGMSPNDLGDLKISHYGWYLLLIIPDTTSPRKGLAPNNAKPFSREPADLRPASLSDWYKSIVKKGGGIFYEAILGRGGGWNILSDPFRGATLKLFFSSDVLSCDISYIL